MTEKATAVVVLSGILLAFLMGCTKSPEPETDTLTPGILATTSIVADVVAQIGGEEINLQTLLPPGTSPHGFQPTPGDVRSISEADLVFKNGLHLEQFLDPLLQQARGQFQVKSVSEKIEPRFFNSSDGHHHDPKGDHADPHVWTDPHNVMLWCETITYALARHDSQHASLYHQRARSYQNQLQQLDQWIEARVKTVPESKRLLVTDHKVLGYFADRYGFKQVGAIIPGFSTLAEPSAQERARLETQIKSLGVNALFVGATMNPQVAERIAEDTGTRMVTIYTGSLSEAGGQADSYIDYMKYNVNAICSALNP
jgi:ABC-type Zn uptake system ZnuABC Zn-binding protein ZnuA